MSCRVHVALFRDLCSRFVRENMSSRKDMHVWFFVACVLREISAPCACNATQITLYHMRFMFASPCFVWDVLIGSSVSAGPLLNGGVGRGTFFSHFCFLPLLRVKASALNGRGSAPSQPRKVLRGMNPPAKLFPGNGLGLCTRTWSLGSNP